MPKRLRAPLPISALSVNVVTTDAVAKPIETVEDSRLRVLRLPAYNFPIMGSHYPIAFGWRKANEFLRCDVVMAHTRFFMTTLAAAAATARMGKRICVVDHGSGRCCSTLVPSLWHRWRTNTWPRQR